MDESNAAYTNVAPSSWLLPSSMGTLFTTASLAQAWTHTAAATATAQSETRVCFLLEDLEKCSNQSPYHLVTINPPPPTRIHHITST